MGNFWDRIKSRAVVVRFPHYGKSYKSYGLRIDHDMPLTGETYAGWRANDNHYTVGYHRETVLPGLGGLLGFPFREEDFVREERRSPEGFDVTMPFPVKDFVYDVECFTTGERMGGAGYGDLVHCGPGYSDYHRLYRYGHMCSRLVNRSLDGGETLFISGDSQMIPDIMPMSAYFREIWYFDNRDGLSHIGPAMDMNFDRVLVEVGAAGEGKYTSGNLR